MGQSPKEIVQAALRSAGPERMLVSTGEFGFSDIAGVGLAYGSLGGPDGVDEWGCRWEKTDLPNTGQVTGHPLEDVSQHDLVQAPDFSLDSRYENSEASLQIAEKEQKYTQAPFFMALFERMHSLAGFEPVLEGILLDPENAGALADKIVDAHISLVRNVQERFGSRVNAFFMTDDWGTQTAAFVSTQVWYDFFFPRYKSLFDQLDGRRAGHDSHGPPRAFRGRRARSREALGEAGGGFVLTSYSDQAILAPPETSRMIYEAFSEVSRELYGKPLPEATFAA